MKIFLGKQKDIDAHLSFLTSSHFTEGKRKESKKEMLTVFKPSKGDKLDSPGYRNERGCNFFGYSTLHLAHTSPPFSPFFFFLLHWLHFCVCCFVSVLHLQNGCNNLSTPEQSWRKPTEMRGFLGCRFFSVSSAQWNCNKVTLHPSTFSFCLLCGYGSNLCLECISVSQGS